MTSIEQRIREIKNSRAALQEEEERLTEAQKLLSKTSLKDFAGSGGRAILSQAEMILGVLEDGEQPSPKRLWDAIKAKYDVEVNRNSFQSVISDLKKRGKIERDGAKLMLPKN